MSTPEERKLADLLNSALNRIEALEKGNRPTQFGDSSLEDSSIRTYDRNGTMRKRDGKQSDGKFATTYANGPAPPKPSPGQVSARELGVVIGWDGSFAGGEDRPTDLLRVDMHVSETSGFTPDGTTVVGSTAHPGPVSTFVDSQTHYVKLVAVNSSLAASSASDEVSFTPLPATNLAVTNQIIIAPEGSLIAGNPDGSHLSFSSEGLRQFDEDGNNTVQFGSSPEAGNTLTVRGTPTETRRNLCSNPKLDNNANGWSGDRATLSRVSGDNISGADWAWRATGNGNDNPRIDFPMTGLSGKTVAFQMTVYTNVTATLGLRVQGYDPQGNGLGLTTLDSADLPAGGSTVLSGVFDVPDNMVDVEPLVRRPATGVTSSDFFDVSLCCIEESPVVRVYFDGDSTINWGIEEGLLNTGFEQDVDGWTATNVMFSQDSSTSKSGTYSAVADYDGNATGSVESNRITTSPGQSVEWRSNINRSSGVIVDVVLRWYDSNNNVIGSDIVAQPRPDATVWKTNSGTATSPEGTSTVTMVFDLSNMGSGSNVNLDELSVLTSTTAQQSTAQWSATPENSMSTIVTPPTRTRTNLAINPKLDNNSDHFSSLRFASTSRVSAPSGFPIASWAWEGTFDGSNSNAALTIQNNVTVRALEQYTVRAMTQTSYDGLVLRVYVDWYNSDQSNYLGPSYSRDFTLTANTAREFVGTFNAPASAGVGHCFLYVPGDDPPGGNTLTASEILVENNGQYLGFFDGDSDNSTWTDTEGNSKSTLVSIGTFQTETRASLSDEGTLSVQSLATDTLTVGGRDLSELVDLKAGTTLAWGQRTNGSPSTTGQIGWFEISFVSGVDRMVRVTTTPLDPTTNATTNCRLHWTTDGTVPQVSTSVLAHNVSQANGNSSTITTLFNPGNNRQVRILLSIRSLDGNSAQIGAFNRGVVMWAEDAGPAISESHIINDGGGSTGGGGGSEPAPQQYNTHWRATAGQTWNQHGFRENANAIQGFYPDGWNGDNKAIFFFDWGAIQNELAGATIDSIAIHVYFYHWYYNSGGYAVFGYSNKASAGGAYEIADWGIAEHHVGKGASKWCSLPRWLGDGFRDGWAKTVNLDSAFKGHDLIYYGKANWDATLGIVYTK